MIDAQMHFCKENIRKKLEMYTVYQVLGFICTLWLGSKAKLGKSGFYCYCIYCNFQILQFLFFQLMKHVLLKIDENLQCFQNTDETIDFAEIASCKFNEVSDKKALSGISKEKKVCGICESATKDNSCIVCPRRWRQKPTRNSGKFNSESIRKKCLSHGNGKSFEINSQVAYGFFQQILMFDLDKLIFE